MAWGKCGGAFCCDLGVGVGAAWICGLVVNGGWKGVTGREKEEGFGRVWLDVEMEMGPKTTPFVVSGVFVDDNFRICVFWVGGKVVGCENAGEACTETVSPWFLMRRDLEDRT